MEAQHALQVPVVVQNLFKLMTPSISFADFKSSRSVCRGWYHESLSFWRKKAVITFHNKPLFSPALSSGGIHPTVFLAELIDSQDFYAFVSKPFEKCKLIDVEVDLEHLQKNRMAVQFWNLVGPTIKHLTLEKVKFSSISFLPTKKMVLNFLRASTPNLEHLELSLISGNMEDSTSYVYSFNLLSSIESDFYSLKSLTLDSTMDIKLGNFPHLQKLKLEDNVNLLDMFDYADGFVNTSIKTLDLIDNIYASYNKCLNEFVRFMELQHLTLSVGYADNRFDGSFNRVEQLSSFIENHVNTLQSIHLLQWSLYEEIAASPFNKSMSSLAELKLWGPVVPDLGILRYMPNIQKLHLDVLGFEKKTQVKCRLISEAGIDETAMLQFLERDLVKESLEKGDMIGVQLPHLTDLFLSCVLSVESVRALGEWMPNLKIVKAILNSTTLPVIIEQWNQIETLRCLFGSQISDSDLTELKKLKRLCRFSYDALCDASELTSGQPLLTCTELTHLEICVSERFPDTEAEQIARKVQNIKILRNFKGNPAHQSWKCCEFKEYRNFIVNAHAASEDDSQDEGSSAHQSSEENE